MALTLLSLGYYLIGFSINLISANSRCLECKGIAQPEDCAVVTKCGSHEKCFVEKYVTNDGLILFNVGCMDSQICSVSNAFGKRMTHLKDKRDETIVCSECCDSKPFSLCNMGGCGQNIPKLPDGAKLCYGCKSANSPDGCDLITLCNKTQSCSVIETTNLLGEHRWNVGCINKASCPLTNAVSSPCASCCDNNICNDQCNVTKTVTSLTQPTVTSLTQPTVTAPLTSTLTPPTVKFTSPTSTSTPTTSTLAPPTLQSTPSPTLSSITQPTVTAPLTSKLTPSTSSTNSPTTSKSTPPSTTSSTTTKSTTASTTASTTTKSTRPTQQSSTRQQTTIVTTTQKTTLTTTQSTTTDSSVSPIIRRVNHPSMIHFGDTVVVSCFADGNPKPSYTFKYRDGPLPGNARSTGNTLTLSNFMPENIGRYECVAVNSAGTGSYGLYLDAKG